MAALILESPPRQYVLFPLVISWQPWYACLPYYLPNLRAGLVTGAPGAPGLQTCLLPPKHQVWQAFAKHFQPGELSQWQAYLNYLAAQEDQDEQDLQAAIRGKLAPVLPAQLDREALWSLAYQLEATLAEKSAVLQQIVAQERMLGEMLGEADAPDQEALPVDVAFSPPLAQGPPDLPLARLRLQFWQEIMAPYLADPWTMAVLEPAAGESSPRFLWEAAREDGQDIWRAGFTLPSVGLPAGQVQPEWEDLDAGVRFQKTLARLLATLTKAPQEAGPIQEELTALVVERLWSGVAQPQAPAVRLEVYAQGPGASEPAVTPAPLLVVSQVS